ncbi:MAG: transglutaminase domain-containing protein [Bacteroidota bacterium]
MIHKKGRLFVARPVRIVFTTTIIFVLCTLGAYSQTRQNPLVDTWNAKSGEIYDKGFMHMVIKKGNDEVSLFDRELIENEAPGSGESDRGYDRDTIWGDIQARKILTLEDPSANKAYLIVMNYRNGKAPLQIEINGEETSLESWNLNQNYQTYIWKEFPADWLKKGENEIIISCPDASEEKEGWVVYLSRADEFEHGGGDPTHVGETSFRSANGGKSWKESPFGPSEDERAEYAIRISMDRYVKEGWLASPVIDLWRCESEEFMVKQRRIRKLDVSMKGEVPEGARIQYYMRRGISPDPYSDEWEDFFLLGEGSEVDWNSGTMHNHRYIQLKAVLNTENPLVSPSFKSATVRLEYGRGYPIPEIKNIKMVGVFNPTVEYPSVEWEWEQWDRPEFRELLERENIEELLAGAQTQFEKQVRLLEYASERWNWSYPTEVYPKWDALSIVNRVNRTGAGGMCIQHNNFLAGLCIAMGWQARHVNIDSHEVCEVWNDDLGKWIYLDASYNHYLWDAETAEPLSLYDINQKFLDFFYPDGIEWETFNGYQHLESDINWDCLSLPCFDPRAEEAGLFRASLSGHKRNPKLGGFYNGGIIRFMPRNNYYEKPYPLPLTHGMGIWPWNSYANWYNDRSPVQRQYSWHTDRKRDLWPTLNTVHIHASSGPPRDRLFMDFETYTPNFSHYEVNTNDTGWREVPANWTWFLRSGRNSLKVRAVSKLGVKGKPSIVELNYADVQFETTF